MNVEDMLADTFRGHEFLAPDPTALLRDLPGRRRRRLRVRMAVAGSVAAVATIAAGTAAVSGNGDLLRNRHVAANPGPGSSQFVFTDATAAGTLIAPADRKPAGDFTGTLLSGGTYSLSRHRGTVVVVSFVASWCGPCLTQAPQFEAAYRRFEANGVGFVGIDTADTRSHGRAFVAGSAITYPVVFDQHAKVAAALGDIPADSLPVTVLVDRRGEVAAVYTGTLASTDLTGPIGVLLAEN